METLSSQEVRKIVLDSQLLNTSRLPLIQIIEHLGYIQIDTISVIERAHHHVFWTRNSNFKATQLKNLEEKERKIFEFWAHAASYLPMKDYRYSLPFKVSNSSQDGHWFKKEMKIMNYVVDRIKSEGPLKSKDFEKPKDFISNAPWHWKPMKKALHQLFMEGKLMVSHREGFQKVYDLSERILPDALNTSMPSKREYIDYLIQRDLRSNGVMSIREIGYLIKGIRNEVETTLKQKVSSGEVLEANIENGKNKYYMLSENLKSLNSRRNKKTFILSPFDNLIIQRNRVKQLFNFNYALECYLPSSKRRIGYFSLPILWGDTFVGQIDTKAERKTEKLIIKNLVLETTLKNPEKLIPSLAKRIKEFAIFNQCREIEIHPSLRKKLGSLSKRLIALTF